MVRFGEPFPISDFKELYKENEQKGMNAFMQELRERMIPQMLNIDDTDHYNEIETLKEKIKQRDEKLKKYKQKLNEVR